jgi:hypothetical protein
MTTDGEWLPHCEASIGLIVNINFRHSIDRVSRLLHAYHLWFISSGLRTELH